MSQFRWPTATLAALLAASAPALAQPAPAPSCDFYQKTLIGTLCQRTVDLDLGVADTHRTITSGSDIPFPPFSLQSSEKTNYNFLGLSGSVSITPLSWLQITLGSSGVVQSNRASGTDTFVVIGKNGLFPAKATFSESSQQSYASYQTLQALANLLDTGPGEQRYVVNVFLGWGFVPGSDANGTPSQLNAKWQTEWFGGVEANAIWRLPGTMYSVVSRTGLQLVQGDLINRTVVQAAQAVLLSHDDWGIAAGPSGYANILTSESGGAGANPTDVYAGAEIRSQPLRKLPVPFLRDLTATIGAYHSVGQAAYVNKNAGKVSEYVVSGDLAWHFYY